jgi:anti-sigma B factor antagonist
MTAPARYLKKKLVISPREALVAGGPAEELERTVHNHLGAGRRTIVIDLGRVPHLDSAGIRALVRGHTTAERLGGRLMIVNPNEQIRSLFAVSHLDRVFNLGEVTIMTPARWATVRLFAWGSLLIVALLWLGSAFPAQEGAAGVFPPTVEDLPVVREVLSAAFVDLAKLLAAALVGMLISNQRRSQKEKPQTARSNTPGSCAFGRRADDAHHRKQH